MALVVVFSFRGLRVGQTASPSVLGMGGISLLRSGSSVIGKCVFFRPDVRALRLRVFRQRHPKRQWGNKFVRSIRVPR